MVRVLWEEPFVGPRIAFAYKALPVVVAKGPLMPEFKHRRHDPKAGPVWGSWYRTDWETQGRCRDRLL